MYQRIKKLTFRVVVGNELDKSVYLLYERSHVNFLFKKYLLSVENCVQYVCI